MNFETSMALLAGMIVGFPILFGLPRLINWITGRKIIPMWIPTLLLVGGIVAGSIYLDSAGVVTSVPLVEKKEEIKLGRNGNWNRSLSLHINYQPPGESTPSYLTLSCDPVVYDSLHHGQTIEARVIDLGRLFRFARLKDRSTFSFVSTIFPRKPAGPWQETTATVRHVTHVTEYISRTRRRSRNRTPIRWPYDIVQLNFTPAGRTDPVTAVDVVEAGTVPGQPALNDGAVVKISWPQDDPRSARIVGATPGRPWTNWFYVVSDTLLIIVGLFAFLALLALFWRRKKRKTLRPQLP